MNRSGGERTKAMLMRTFLILSALLALGVDAAAAKSPRHTQRQYSQPAAAAAPFAGTLVLHPASNIACNTPYRAARALPCDQPVWVYGSPCEIDLGLGRYRSCD
jgi:hypothetical protein